MSNYYIAPSDETFEEIKRTAISIWSNPNYGYHQMYIDEKVGMIKDIGNIKDNYAHIIGQFDVDKQIALITLLSDKAKSELFDEDRLEGRLSGGYRKTS